LLPKKLSQCRNFPAQRLPRLVQDDSGIPYRYLEQNGASLRFFGHYVGTTGGSSPKRATRPRRRYAKTTTADLDFSLSYQWNPKTANYPHRHAAAAPKSHAPHRPRRRRNPRQEAEAVEPDPAARSFLSVSPDAPIITSMIRQSSTLHRHRQYVRGGPDSHALAAG